MTGPVLAALQAALAAEHAACYGYGVVGAHLNGAQYLEASTDWIAHQRSRDALTSMISARGGRPTPAGVAYKLPLTVRSRASAIALAVLLEQDSLSAYPVMVALAEPTLRTFAAAQMQQAAARAARWSGRSEAFPGLARP
jgi:uncharacterized protein DUF4439